MYPLSVHTVDVFYCSTLSFVLLSLYPNKVHRLQAVDTFQVLMSKSSLHLCGFIHEIGFEESSCLLPALCILVAVPDDLLVQSSTIPKNCWVQKLH